MSSFRKNISEFLKNDKDSPFLAGFISGFYPFLFYTSNNFSSVNSIKHFLLFSVLFLIVPTVVFGAIFYLFKKNKFLSQFKTHFLFIFIILNTISLLYYVSFLGTQLSLKKTILATFLAIACVFGVIALSLKYSEGYKKIIVIIMVVSILPFVKLTLNVFEHLKSDTWMDQPDKIEEVKFLNKPNIYFIQPDGYVSESTMQKPPYNHESVIYDWLANKGFKLYDNFRSNYPATLVSNSSVFGMKQHYYKNMLFPSIEMPNARRIICGDNPVVKIFKQNNYKTNFIVGDEYLQQNNSKSSYDYNNIELEEIPLFSTGDMVKKDVFLGLKALQDKNIASPSFYFIEKLEPHHINIQAVNNMLKEERDIHIGKVEKANIFLKEIVNYIEKKDHNAIVIILADHGGFVGIENYQEMYGNNNPKHINSTFSTLAAIKWNGYLKNDFDEGLKTNVNLFRVLFSVLSENEDYLNHLEDNSSYNLNYENPFYNSVYKVIDNDGNLRLKSESN